MATVLVRTTNKKLPKLYRKIRIETVDGKVYVDLPQAPLQVSYSGFGWNWEEVAREGRAPIIVPGSYKTKKMNFSGSITPKTDKAKDGSQKAYPSIEGDLIKLERLASSQEDVRVTYAGGFENRLWHIDDFSWTSTMRDPYNNKTTAADIELSFILSVNIDTNVGPVSGGVKPKAKTTPTAKKPTTKTSKAKTYTVKRGDTLSGIAVRFYRDSSKYRQIATLNKIRNPHLIYPGKLLRLP